MFYGVRILERVRAEGRGSWEKGCEPRKVKSDASWKRLVFDRISEKVSADLIFLLFFFWRGGGG